jgi:multiple sugar transport system permease protein
VKKTRTTKQRWQKTFVILALIPGSLFAGFPVLWMFSNSIKSNSDIFAYPPKFIPKNISFASYSAIFTDPEKIRFFINSYSIALAVTIFTLLVSIPAAYTFSRYNFKFKQVINDINDSVLCNNCEVTYL